MKKTEHINFSMPEVANSETIYEKIVPKYGKEPDNFGLSDGEIDELFWYYKYQENIFYNYPESVYDLFELYEEEWKCLNSIYDYPDQSEYPNSLKEDSYSQEYDDEFERDNFELFYLEPSKTNEFEEMGVEELDVAEDNCYLNDFYPKDWYPQENGFYDNTDGGHFFELVTDFGFFFLPSFKPPKFEEISNSELFSLESPIFPELTFEEMCVNMWDSICLDTRDYPGEDIYPEDDYPKDYPNEYIQSEDEEEKFWMTAGGLSIKSVFHGVENWLEDQYIEKMIEDHYSKPLNENETQKTGKIINIKDLSNDDVDVNVNDFDSDIVGHLIDSLRDSDRNVRKEAANALGMIADPQSVEYLIEALNDPEERVMLSAAEALGKIGDEQGLSPLIKLLNGTESPKIQVKIMEALMGIGKHMKEKYPEEFENSTDVHNNDYDSNYDDDSNKLPNYDKNEIVSNIPSFRERTRRLNKRLIDENDEYMDDIISGLYGREQN